MTLKVGILNVTGYAGAELARILHRHPEVSVVSATGRSLAGKLLSEIYPHLEATTLTVTKEPDVSLDFVFSALPHAASAEQLNPFIMEGIPCVDVAADFRLKNLDLYESTYKTKHPCPEHLEKSTYGLPEIHREKIKTSKLVANPGCFPTGAILGMAPAVSSSIIESSIINDSKTGVSGAGRSSKAEFGFSEINDSAQSYGLSGHRHQPEMEQELSELSKIGDIKVSFVPHLIPMTRGILGTNYARLTKKITQEDVYEIYNDYFSNENFVKIVQTSPSTKHTWGNNNCLIHPIVKESDNLLVVTTVLDNLVKGAAGAAVQNMNLMVGFPEKLGLDQLAIYP